MVSFIGTAVDIPKYSDWKKNAPKELEIDTESFKALFSKRDGRTPNEQMHNFLKAYAIAVNRFAILQQDEDKKRFPHLDEVAKIIPEVNASVQGEVVYNLKRRFIQNTEFFEERTFGTKGVYLLPKALRFRDKECKYSDLIFDFDNGAVILPELKPLPSPEKSPEPLKEISPEEQTAGERTSGDAEKKSKEQKTSESLSAIEGAAGKSSLMIKSVLILGIIIAAVITLAYLLSTPPDKPMLRDVTYRFYDSNDAGGDFLMFELSNPSGIPINSTVVLPPKVVSDIIVEKGPVSINQSGSTIIRLNTDKDARVKMYAPAFESVPLIVTHYYTGNPDAVVNTSNNNNLTRSAEKFQWHFEYKKPGSIEIMIKPSSEDS
ncbi:MAG: hypothetical protein OIN66_14425 [Candidatus Methanoperedens sp.]|nr:hypothetical protein [Candidatus Methanoperedens sp.]